MNQDGSSLKLPLMLLTEPTSCDSLAQRLLYPVAQLLATQANQAIDTAITTASVDPNHPIASLSNLVAPHQPGLIAVTYLSRPSKQTTAISPRPTVGAGVAERLVRFASCPVLVVRGDAPALNQPVWKHVLLVVNRSNATKQAIAIAHQLVPIGIERITILCVQSPLNASYPLAPFSPLAMPASSWQLNHSLKQVQKEQSDRLMQQARAGFNDSEIEIQTVVQTTEPGPLICQLAQQANVIILGDQAKQWSAQANQRIFRYARLSPTSRYVLHHAPCPILFCHTAEEMPLRLFTRPKIRQRLQKHTTQDSL